MQLLEAIFAVGDMMEDSVICARQPFDVDSEALIARFTNDYRIPDDVKAQGFDYFLGKNEVAELLEMISGKQASREMKAEFICHYALFDAYPEWFDDLPNIAFKHADDA